MKRIFLNLKAFILSQNNSTAEKISKILLRNSMKMSSAESCTGGLISSRMTDIGGSSAFTSLNFVTYSPDAKNKILGVKQETIDNFGVVSAECAQEMAYGLFKITKSDVVVCTTGVAGPVTIENKPVGLMYCACAVNGKISIKKIQLNPNYTKKNMKFMFSEEALKFVLEEIK